MRRKLPLLALLVGFFLVVLGFTLAWSGRSDNASAANPTPTVVATVAVGTEPFGVAVNPNTNRIYVANYGSGTVSVIDGSSNMVIATVTVGTEPFGVAVFPYEDRAYVTNNGSDTVSAIDAANTVFLTIPVGSGPSGVAVNTNTDPPVGGRLFYVANGWDGTVSYINARPQARGGPTIPVGPWPLGVAVNPNTNRIYVANNDSDTVSVINGDTNTVVATVTVASEPLSQPFGVAVNPNSNLIYVANRQDGNVSVIDGASNTVAATVAVGTNPQGVAVNPYTNRIYVANSGDGNSDGTVSVIDGANNTVVASVAVGSNPLELGGGVAVNPNTNLIYVTNGNDGTVSVIQDMCFSDSDCDGVPDATDNCPLVSNPDQLNSDGGRRPNGPKIPFEWASNPAQDKLGDVCDPDNDNDALPDTAEAVCAPGPVFSCPAATCQCDLNVGTRPQADTCQLNWCDPLNADTDGDRFTDGYEVVHGSNPLDPNSKPPNPNTLDSDGDGLYDGIEHHGYNTCAFTGDAVPGYSTCANPADSDGDGCADILEVLDINGDRVNSVGDLSALARRSAPVPWPGFEPDPVSDKIYDVNKDGLITIGDLSLMARNSCYEKPGLLGCPVCAPE